MNRARAFWQGSKDTPSVELFAIQMGKTRGKQILFVSLRGKQEILLMVIWLTCLSMAMTHLLFPAVFLASTLTIAGAQKYCRSSQFPLCPTLHVSGSLRSDKDRRTIYKCSKQMAGKSDVTGETTIKCIGQTCFRNTIKQELIWKQGLWKQLKLFS